MSIQKIISGNPYRNGGGVILTGNSKEGGDKFDGKIKKITPPIMTEPTLPRVNEDYPQIVNP